MMPKDGKMKEGFKELQAGFEKIMKEDRSFGKRTYCAHCWACRKDWKTGCIATKKERTEKLLCVKSWDRFTSERNKAKIQAVTNDLTEKQQATLFSALSSAALNGELPEMDKQTQNAFYAILDDRGESYYGQEKETV